MLFKSISLKNYQQFIDEKIEFSTDSEKNITLICGGNTSGKTTIVNAMKWCLFGNDNIPETNLLNKDSKNNMEIGDKNNVEVQIVLLLNQKEYLIKRIQTYEKINDKEVKIVNSEFCVTPQNPSTEYLNLEYFKYLFVDCDAIHSGNFIDMILLQFKKEFGDEFISDVKNKATEIFELFTNNLGKKLTIEDYGLATGERVLLNISTVLAINCFVSEIKLGKSVKLPLVMDSILSLLDNKKIQNVAKIISSLTNQLILLGKELDLFTFQESAKNNVGKSSFLKLVNDTNCVVTLDIK